MRASCDDRNAYTGTAEILLPVRKARAKVPAEFGDHFRRWLNQNKLAISVGAIRG